MGGYFLFNQDTSPEEKNSVEKKLQELGYSNSYKGVLPAKAVGVCTYRTMDVQSYTFLDEEQASDKPSKSWTVWRKELGTLDDFYAFAKKQMEAPDPEEETEVGSAM